MQQLKEFYERQDTEELLDISQKDLTDSARAVMAEVLASRGIGEDVVAGARATAVQAKAVAAEAASNVATRRIRLLAFAIDMWGVGSLIYLVFMPLKFVGEELYLGAAALLWLAYMLFRDGIPGQSAGKRLLGFGVVHMDSGRPCTWMGSLWRNLTHLFFVIDAVFILGERRMRLGDMIAGTQVVRTK